MKKLPNAVKWLIILVVLGAMGAMMWAISPIQPGKNWIAP